MIISARVATDIYYGADDNASGTTGVTEMARRFSAMKNRQGRRIVFIAFYGEEMRSARLRLTIARSRSSRSTKPFSWSTWT